MIRTGNFIMKQISIKKITGKFVVKTGLHIGAGNDEVHIGGGRQSNYKKSIKFRTIHSWLFNKRKNAFFNGMEIE